nr:YetF domain-containing protein [Bacillus coahuilensis]
MYEDLFQLARTTSAPQAVINDGILDTEVLEKMKYTKEWLIEELSKRSLTTDEVFLAQLDDDGFLTLDLYDWTRKKDKPKPIPNSNP